MWLFTKVGFFSVTRARGLGDKLVVRARVAADLDALRATYAPDLSETVKNAGTDYPYRAFIDRRAFGVIAQRIAEDIDYRNFKDVVLMLQGPVRHDLYALVWQVMYDAEAKLSGPWGRREEKPARK